MDSDNPAFPAPSPEAEDPFPEGEERFRLLLETLPFMGFVIRPGGMAWHYNRRFIDYHGRLPGPDTASRTAMLHPADRETLERARNRGVAAGTDYVVEVRLQRHDGEFRWHRVHNRPLRSGAQTVAWLGTAIDIDDLRRSSELLERRVRERTGELERANQLLRAEAEERRAAEARYRELYDRTPMALHSVGATARLLDVNETWLEMFACRREEAIGRSPTEFMTQRSAEMYLQRTWPQMLSSSGQVRTEEYTFVARTGRQFEGRLTARGQFDERGQFVRSWSAIADITAEKRAQAELLHLQRTEAFTQLTAGVAHDFNNLLTAIMGSLEMLEKRLAKSDAVAARRIAVAREATDRGARLTSQLLAFARQQRLLPEPTDLNRTVGGSRTILETTLGPEFRVEIAGEPGLWTALCDPTQAELMLLNLALNARDAMPGGGTVRITTTNARRLPPLRPEEPVAGDYVALTVADTGPGIPEAVRGRIFDPFFTTKAAGAGSGLGLPQVLGVAKQLGGGVALETEAGRGTSVSVFFPAVPPGP